MEMSGIRETPQPLDDKGAKMKPLLTCLLVGCLVSSVCCAQERNLTLEEFVQKLEDGQPWTREKMEAQLGVKLIKVSPRVNRATGQFVYGEGLIINAISYDILEKTNEVDGIRMWFDDKSSCFTRERIKQSYPSGDFSDRNLRPGGGVDYEINRGWAWIAFHFGDKRKLDCLTEISFNVKRVVYINE
jgi:hypothetical protein